MEEIIYRPIGVIHSSHSKPEETPIQPIFAEGCRGTAEIFPEYGEGLMDLEGFSHIYLLFYFHQAENCRLKVKPYLEDVEHGVFATRAPCRPNRIGISIVRLLSRSDNILELDDLDIIDGTPLIDIKPYCAKFDCIATLSNGWQDYLIDHETVAILGRRNYRREEEK
ncbi:MAG: tRNA (N6-threonylcarbamoyladenosine(37)-N6)-methyltransferase TrmO [Lentisphaerae bacterium]|nr:tRNA (N6-threonylcarbamoyladenosine(37)-N6)-methyltransferase TrmO [Lentisphaerota bacterium]